jgi:hypothetical protein
VLGFALSTAVFALICKVMPRIKVGPVAGRRAPSIA